MSALSSPIFLRSADLKRLIIKLKNALAQRLARWYTNYRTRQELAELPDYILKDIGITRADAEREADKAFWKD